MFTPMQNPNTFAALAFLSGSSPDREGRYVNEYFTFDAARWEQCHNHIQWAFPSSVPSMFNSDAPIIDFSDFLLFTYVDGEPVNREALYIFTALGGLMERYIDSIGISVSETGAFSVSAHPERLGWLDNPHDHNHRRLTRLFMLWYHVQEPLKRFNEFSSTVQHFESLYYYISTALRAHWDDEVEETLTYWDRAFHQGTN